MVEGEPACEGERKWQYKLEGQSGRRRGIAGVPGELSERTARRGVWWMSRLRILKLFGLPVVAGLLLALHWRFSPARSPCCHLLQHHWAPAQLRDSLDQRVLKVVGSDCSYIIDWPLLFLFKQIQYSYHRLSYIYTRVYIYYIIFARFLLPQTNKCSNTHNTESFSFSVICICSNIFLT